MSTLYEMLKTQHDADYQNTIEKTYAVTYQAGFMKNHMNANTCWTLNEAIAFINRLEDLCAEDLGVHFGLLGGVMRKGCSSKDLDIAVYPHKKPHSIRLSVFNRVLEKRMGIKFETHNINDSRAGRNSWSNNSWGSPDDKHVSVYKTADGRRLDLFIFEFRLQ